MNPVTKSYIALAIMFGCFVVLYPKVFHPWIKIIFGLNPKPQQEEQPFHPRDRAMRGMPGREPPAPAGRMHPGARFQEDAASKRQGTSKGGMSSFMLPVYAIGIMLYLGYTLLKIWSKRNNQNESAEEWLNAQRQQRSGQQPRSRDRTTNPTQQSGLANITQPSASASAPVSEAKRVVNDPKLAVANDSAGLAALLRNADFDSMSYSELRALRRRLEETESRMTNLLNEVGVATKAAESLAAAAVAESLPRSADYDGEPAEVDGEEDDANRNLQQQVGTDQQNSEPESDTPRKSEPDSDGRQKSEADSETEKAGDVTSVSKNAAKKKKKKQKAAAKKQQAEFESNGDNQLESPPQHTLRKRAGASKQKQGLQSTSN